MKHIITSLFLLTASLFAQAEGSASADSLSMLLGRSQGAMINQQLHRMSPSPEFKAGFLNGLKTILEADTTNPGFFEGVQTALAMTRDLVQLNRLGAKVNIGELLSAFEKSYSSATFDTALINADNRRIGALLAPLQEMAEHRRTEALQATRTANMKAGKAFIDSLMIADKDVHRSNTGLVYKLIKKGKGTTPREDSEVAVKYTGRKINGQVFDTSGDETRSFTRSGVIKGFGEGLGMMNKGAKYIFYIPADLAYGDAGAGQHIQPGETLIFEVELVDIQR